MVPPSRGYTYELIDVISDRSAFAEMKRLDILLVSESSAAEYRVRLLIKKWAYGRCERLSSVISVASC